jgi:MFS family permease
MIVARGIAGFGAGGEYPVCATSATEAADETAQLRRRRGLLVALTTDFAVDMVSTASYHIRRNASNSITGICCSWFGCPYCTRLLQSTKHRRRMANYIWARYCGKSTVPRGYWSQIMLTPETAATFNLLLPCSDDQFYPIPKVCYQIAISILASTTSLLETHAWNM